ncbi:MAG: Fic family protein [Candidatus Aminicenantes bacterium]|nr:Fic family protein [Candidatus Aminicenantes bacterium]
MTTNLNQKPPAFIPIDLRLFIPDYSSELTDLVMHLEYLRKLRVIGTTPKQTFFQIKKIFHTLESIGSARIEGNRTTVIEYIDRKLENDTKSSDALREIENMEAALNFIDENVEHRAIDRAFISELHKMVVDRLREEGSKSPGDYRTCPVKIRSSALVPPLYVSIPSYMEELIHFIGKDDPPKYDLLKIAQAHHRFVWIHPFDNGNGRVVRLLTYAMMVKFGFKIHLARVLNPAAIFCYDREKYYAALARADRGDDEGYSQWAMYMLSGLKRELEKTDKLADYDYLKEEILKPTIRFSLEKNVINNTEAKILFLAVEKREIANADIRSILPNKHISNISHIIRKLIEKKYLMSTETSRRRYSINFRENKLIRGIIVSLDKAGFLPGNP